MAGRILNRLNPLKAMRGRGATRPSRQFSRWTRFNPCQRRFGRIANTAWAAESSADSALPGRSFPASPASRPLSWAHWVIWPIIADNWSARQCSLPLPLVAVVDVPLALLHRVSPSLPVKLGGISTDQPPPCSSDSSTIQPQAHRGGDDCVLKTTHVVDAVDETVW